MVSIFKTSSTRFAAARPRAPTWSMPIPALHARRRGDIVEAMWLPALEAFKPEMIFISAGFDAHRLTTWANWAWWRPTTSGSPSSCWTSRGATPRGVSFPLPEGATTSAPGAQWACMCAL